MIEYDKLAELVDALCRMNQGIANEQDEPSFREAQTLIYKRVRKLRLEKQLSVIKDELEKI